METKQINLKLAKNLLKIAEQYAEDYGYRNVQELAAESLREKIFEENEFDESFSDKEIALIDSIIELSIKKKVIISEQVLKRALLG